MPGNKQTPVIVRFWAKVEITLGCWIWHGERDKAGYGKLRRGAPTFRKEMAHRLAYELFVGLIPEGLTLDHLCRNTSCVNPDHLEPVTIRENTLRGTNPIAQNARKTHCVRGHRFSPENTAYVLDGTERRCRECMRIRDRIYHPTTSPANARKTHCLNGHPFSGDNLRVLPNGERRCRQCSRDRKRRYKAPTSLPTPNPLVNP